MKQLVNIYHLIAKPSILAMALAMLMIFVSGCKKTPDWIIQPEEMAQLMADVHTAEAVVDYNYSSFPTDSAKQALKQSVFAAHGVSSEQVDTSLVWYGNNIEQYIKVYDRTLEILQERQGKFASATSQQMAVTGDSVEVWSGPRRVTVSESMPSRIITFSILPDSTWRNGDVYSLKFKPINPQGRVEARILADYSNGTTRYIETPNTARMPNHRRLQLDSTLTPLRVYGYLTFEPEEGRMFEVDSISVVRERHQVAKGYYSRGLNFDNGIVSSEEESDSIDTSVIEEEEDHGRIRLGGVTGRRHRSEAVASSANRPEASSSSASTEHRQGAAAHKPTQQQRREAQSRRTIQHAQPKKAGGKAAAPMKATDQRPRVRN